MIKPGSLGVRSAKGLSLIEVCLAIAIVAIIFTHLSFIFDQGYSFLRKTRLSRLAFFLAEEEMERLLDSRAVDDPDDGWNITTKTAFDPPFAAFQRQISIDKTASSVATACGGTGCGGRLAEVNVTVYWNGTSGEQSFSLVSLVSNATH